MNSEQFAIIDTSFVESLRVREWWAVEAQRILEEKQPTLLVPGSVQREYDRLRDASTISDTTGYEKVQVPPEISSEEFTIDRILSAETFPELGKHIIASELLREPKYFPIKKPKRLSSTDLDVGAAALYYANEGSTFLVTGDEGITERVREAFVHREGDVTILSPKDIKPQPAEDIIYIPFRVAKELFAYGKHTHLRVAKQLQMRGDAFGQVAVGFGDKFRETNEYLPVFALSREAYLADFKANPNDADDARIVIVYNTNYFPGIEMSRIVGAATVYRGVFFDSWGTVAKRLTNKERKKARNMGRPPFGGAIHTAYDFQPMRWALIHEQELGAQGRQRYNRLRQG